MLLRAGEAQGRKGCRKGWLQHSHASQPPSRPSSQPPASGLMAQPVVFTADSYSQECKVTEYQRNKQGKLHLERGLQEFLS